MMEIKKTLSNTFCQLIVIYTLLVFTISLSLFSRFTYHFEFFAIILSILGFITLSRSEEKISKRARNMLIILSAFAILALRIIPYIGNPVPIGYDAGLYKYALDSGLENKDAWLVRGGMEPGFLYLMESFSFISSDFMLTYGFIFFTLLLGLMLYFSSREFFGERTAVMALLIYALSPAQFLVFTYMYYKNIIGLILLLSSSIFLIRYERSKKKKYLAAFILSSALLGSMHRPTFYIFGLSYLVYSFISPYNGKYSFPKLKTNIIAGIAILALSSIFYLGDFMPAITSILSPVASSIVEPGHAPGTFIDFTGYQFLILPYLAFSLIGFFASFRSKDSRFLSVWFIINAIIVLFQLFFFNRFIIHLDIIAIIFAGLGFSMFISNSKKIALPVIALLLLSSGILSLQISMETQPIISDESLSLIKSLSAAEEDAYVISISSEYSPFVIGYSGRKTIAPGLFDFDFLSRDEWEEFWSSPGKERTIELLSRYQGPIYLFAGTKEYSNECFSIYSENAGNKVFKYIC